MKAKIHYLSLTLLLLVVLALVSCGQEGSGVGTQAPVCETVTDVEGEYRCAGECVTTGADGSKELVSVADETDTVQRFPAAREHFYQVKIVGGNDFHEVEIGPLVGLVLRTATAEVSDGQFPVLEEYVFKTDPTCKARGFTKIVRNPSAENFKSCVIHCEKNRP